MMKPSKILWIAGFLAAGMFSCKSFEGGTATITPNPLEVHGDEVEFVADVNIPANNKIKKGMVYVVRPELGDYKFEPVRIDLDQYPDARSVGIHERLAFSAPFLDDDMINNDLEIEHEVMERDGDTDDLQDMDDLAECCITTSQLFLPIHEYQFSEVMQEDPNAIKMVAQFNFPLDKWDLDESELTAYDEQMIRRFIMENQGGDQLYVHGYASPEGPWDRNVTLSTNRAQVVKNLMEDRLSGMNLDFTLANTVEDWDGFYLKVKNADDLSSEEKAELMNIAMSDADPVTKERMLQQAAGGGNIHNTEVEEKLAPLRRTTVVINGDANKFTLEELDSIALAFAEGYIDESELEQVFSREEWLEAAQATYAATGKKSLLVSYYETYPEDYRVYNDLGLLSLLEGVPLGEMGLASACPDVKVKVDGDEWQYENECEDVTIKFEGDEFKYEDDGAENEVKFKIDDGEGKLKVAGEDVIRYDAAEATLIGYKYVRDYKPALDYFMKAYSLDPSDVGVMSNIGAVLSANRDFSEAKDYLLRSINTSPTPQAHYNLGVIYAIEGEYDAALTHFAKSENKAKLKYNIGLTKLLSGDYSGARADLEDFVAAFPDEAYGWYLLAVVGARTGDINMVNTNIAKACALSNELCDRAEEDLEFRNYWDVDSFEDATD